MPGFDSTDDELMARVAHGDSVAFKKLFKKHGGHLLGYAQRYLVQKEKAEEVTQDIWMRVIRLAPNYKSEGHFVAWLYTMTRNLCFNSLRKDKKMLQSEDIDSKIEAQSIDRSSLEDEILNRSNFSKIKNAIDQLPLMQRSALLMYAIDGMNYNDIADELSVSLSAVKSLIFRARSSLGAYL
jgi:RNA polymerase sigma-70 factor (ECF subfamily)